MTLAIVPHLLAGAFGDLLAFVHDDDTVGETHDHVELVLDQQDRQSFGFQFGDQPLHFAGLGRVHAGRRLVEQQQARLERQRTRDLDTAPVGVGQAVGRLIDAWQQTLAKPCQDRPHLFAQPLLFGLNRSGSQQRQSQLQQRPDQRRGRPDGTQPRMRADQDILHHAEVAEHATELERACDTAARQFLGRKAGDRRAHRDGPRHRRACRARSRD